MRKIKYIAVAGALVALAVPSVASASQPALIATTPGEDGVGACENFSRLKRKHTPAAMRGRRRASEVRQDRCRTTPLP